MATEYSFGGFANLLKEKAVETVHQELNNTSFILDETGNVTIRNGNHSLDVTKLGNQLGEVTQRGIDLLQGNNTKQSVIMATGLLPTAISGAAKEVKKEAKTQVVGFVPIEL